MSEWQDISTAPKDGTWIQARIPGHGFDNIIFWMGGLLDCGSNECGGWAFATEDQEPPDCWTDGICWASNEDGNQSIEPTHWKPLTGAARMTGVTKRVSGTCKTCGEQFTYKKGRGRDRLYCSQRCLRATQKKSGHAVYVSSDTYRKIKRLKKVIEQNRLQGLGIVTNTAIVKEAVKLLSKKEGVE